MFFLPFAAAENPVQIYDSESDIEVLQLLNSGDEDAVKEPAARRPKKKLRVLSFGVIPGSDRYISGKSSVLVSAMNRLQTLFAKRTSALSTAQNPIKTYGRDINVLEPLGSTGGKRSKGASTVASSRCFFWARVRVGISSLFTDIFSSGIVGACGVAFALELHRGV